MYLVLYSYLNNSVSENQEIGILYEFTKQFDFIIKDMHTKHDSIDCMTILHLMSFAACPSR